MKNQTAKIDRLYRTKLWYLLKVMYSELIEQIRFRKVLLRALKHTKSKTVLADCLSSDVFTCPHDYGFNEKKCIHPNCNQCWYTVIDSEMSERE